MFPNMNTNFLNFIIGGKKISPIIFAFGVTSSRRACYSIYRHPSCGRDLPWSHLHCKLSPTHRAFGQS